MISANDLRRGTVFEMDGELYRVVEYQHSFIGRGSATVRVKVRNLRTGALVERTFPPEERIKDVRLETREVQYLYRDGDLYYFMDTETYEQPALSAEALGEAVNYLTEGMVLELSTYEGKPVEVELPVTVDLKVVEAPPGFAGDTATSATKWVTLETGLKIQVPLFVKEGDVVRVDTRTGEYVTRV
ncbi:MAG TPA: elongation factor P [Anaerolineae bacterium]|nr:elongation factor P [Anaerolineae bacterium]